MPPAASPVTRVSWVDPEQVFAVLSASLGDLFWLDAGPEADTGWSWLGTGEREVDRLRVRDVVVGGTNTTPAHSGPFRGGWVGWIDYESGGPVDGAPAAPHRDAWLRVGEMLAFDHAHRRVWATGPAHGAVRRALAVASAPAPLPPVPPGPRVATGRDSAEHYARLITECQARIRDGDAYQLCLTTRFSVPGPVDAPAAYRRLRQLTPSHHGGFVRIDGTALCSASPERFLHASDGVVRTHPIKGTRPRHSDPVRDARLAGELAGDVKERAENVMIVDLMRNDLSAVSTPGTVTVDRLLEVESYAAVHQLVSSVSGTLAPGTTLGGLLDAAFPAGSMTGAPKLAAMAILRRLEAMPRGPYAGCFGWVGDDGSADLAMTIRSVVVEPDQAWVGAGGGITWRSDPAAEVAEVGLKARAPLAALGAEVPPGW